MEASGKKQRRYGSIAAPVGGAALLAGFPLAGSLMKGKKGKMVAGGLAALGTVGLGTGLGALEAGKSKIKASEILSGKLRPTSWENAREMRYREGHLPKRYRERDTSRFMQEAGTGKYPSPSKIKDPVDRAMAKAELRYRDMHGRPGY